MKAPSRPRWRLALAITLAGIALTVALGIWQVQRLAWKQGLLAEIDRAEAAPAIPLPPDPVPFAKVRAEGRFDGAHAVYYGALVRGGRPGARLLVPLLRDGAAPVLVDRGFVPLPWDGDPATAAASGAVEAYVRPPDTAGWFTPADDPAARRFYTLDPAAIGRAIGVPGLAPYVLVALGSPGGVPEPAQALPRPPNNHLGYAVTWFGLAAALAGVFAVYIRKELSRR